LKLTTDENYTIEKISLLSGVSKENTRAVFENLLNLIVINHTNGESTYVPFMGEINLIYRGNDYHGFYKKAIIESDFSPSEEIIRNIGQIEDGEETDIEKVFQKKLQNSLSEKLESFGK